jgi:hypothetical protein
MMNVIKISLLLYNLSSEIGHPLFPTSSTPPVQLGNLRVVLS